MSFNLYEKKASAVQTNSGFNLNRNDITYVPLKTADGKDFGKVSYKAFKAVERGTLDSYTPINDEEKKIIDDYIGHTKTPEKANEEKASETEKEPQNDLITQSETVEMQSENNNAVFEKYNINPETFDYDDLGKWAAEHNYTLESNASGVRYVPKRSKGDFLGFGSKKLSTKQEDEDFKVLEAAAYENAYKKAAKEAPTTMSALSVASAPVRGVAGAAAMVKDSVSAIVGKDVNTYDRAHKVVDSANIIRETVTDEYASKWFGGANSKLGNYGALTYNGIMSIGDMVMTSLTTKGIGAALGLTGKSLAAFTSNATSGLLASTSGASTVMEKKKEGLSDGKAVLNGLAAAGSEFITEKISLDMIFKKPASVIKKGLISFLSEGSEEMISDVLTKTADYFISGDDSTIKKNIESYMQNGMSKKDAVKQATWDSIYETLSAGLVGGFSGVAVSSAYHGFGRSEIKKTGSDMRGVAADVIESGLDSPKNSNAYKYAEKISKKGVDKITDYELGLQHIYNIEQIEYEQKKEEKATKKAEKTARKAQSSVSETADNTEQAPTNFPYNVYAEPQISVGDTFHDTKTGTTLTVISRDANNTVVRVNESGIEKTYTNDVADMMSANPTFEKVDSTPDTEAPQNTESAETLSPEDAQKYNIVVSNLKRKAEELGLLDTNFFNTLQNVNLYNPSASDRAAISSEFRRVFAGNTDLLVTDWLNAIGVDASSVSDQNNANMVTSDVKTTQNSYSVTTNDNKTMYDIMDELGLTYDEQRAIIEYKSSGSYKINEALRKRRSLSAEQEKLKNDLNSALDRFLAYKGTVYRNIGFETKEEFDEFVFEHTGKTSITYFAFTSASKTIDSYLVDAPYRVHYEISSYNSKDVSNIGLTKENEVLFKTDTEFAVKSFEANGKEIIILCEELANNGKRLQTFAGETGNREKGNGYAKQHDHLRRGKETDQKVDSVREGSGELYGVHQIESASKRGNAGNSNLSDSLGLRAGNRNVSMAQGELERNDVKGLDNDGKGKFEGTLENGREQRRVQENSSETGYTRNSEIIFNSSDSVRGRGSAYDEVYTGASESNRGRTGRRSESQDLGGNTETRNDGKRARLLSGIKDLPEAFKRDDSGKIRFNQVDINYDNYNYREDNFNILVQGKAEAENLKGGIVGKYGVHKKDNGYFGVNLLSSGMDIAAFESFKDALKFAAYTNENVSFNDVSYTRNAEGRLTIEATPEFMQYGEQIRAIKNEKTYLQTEIATDESQTETSAVTKKDGVSFKPNSKTEDVNNSSFRETSTKVLKNKVENDTIKEDVGVIKYSLESENKKFASQIDDSFNSAYDKWIADGKPNRKVLIVGQTSKALQSIGVKKQQITWDTSKINKSIKEHPDLSDAILKKIPQVLESPIIVMQSLQSDSRLTMFGDLADESGKPVLVVIELAATSRSNIQLDEIKVVSTYGKDNAQSLINRSDILYVEPNKKRTNNWLMSNRLQLPLDITNYGSIKSITYPAGDVNTYSMQKQGKHSFESKAENENKKFASQIDKWLSGNMKSSEQFELGQTPDVLKELGAKNLPVVMSQNVMLKITGIKHSISVEEIKKLPSAIADPIMVFKSATVDGAFVILTELTDKSGNDVVVAMHLNRSEKHININRVASVYGKENVENFIKTQTNGGNLRYIDVNKSQAWSQSRGLQLPKLADTTLDNNNITQKEDIVNIHSTQKTGKYSFESEAENEQGNNILNGSKQRNVSERSSKQTERVGKSSRRGSKKSIRERQEFVRTLTDAQKEERILIDSEGKRHKFTIVKKSAWNEHMKSIAKHYETKGLTIEFVDGGIKIEWVKRFARGMRNGDTIYVSYNSTQYSPEQIAEHEYTHNKYDSDEVQEARKQILERMPKEEYDKSMEEVGKAYSGVAKKIEIEEELICNILSGMYENSADYADLVSAYRSKTEGDMSGYDVSQYAENIDAGGELNESRNTKELGKQGIGENNDSVWQRSDDSEGVYECLGTGKKRLYRSQEEGNRHIDWGRRFGDLNVYEPREKEHAYGVLRKISQLKISSQDSDGRKLSKEQKNFFKDTVAKNSKGELFTLYHATDAQFNEFLFGDFAFHVGTLGQALRIDNKGKKYIKEVYVNITNPVFISEDTMHWPGLAVASKLEAQGIISSSDYKNLSKVDGFWKIDYNSDANKEIRNILKEKGYDGIVYNNGFEGDSISFMAFDPNQIKYTSNKKPTTNSDLRYSLADDGEYDLFDLWEQKNNEFGTIKKGENPARDINVPKKISKDKLVSRFARTMLEAGVTPDFAVSEFERAILDGTMTHEKITNKNAEKKAKEKIKRDGFSEAMRDWETYSKDGKVSKDAFVLGMELYNQCITNKDVTNAMKIAAELVAETTRAGQTLQAARMLKRMSPDGQLYYIEKSVQKMEQEFKNKLGDKFSGITLDEELMKEFLTAADEEKRNAVYDEICQSIADQVPVTNLDKWDSWRRLAMLGNPSSHLRNIIGNVTFAVTTRLKNYVGAVIEISARIDATDRTKSMRKTKAAVEFAKGDFQKVMKELQGQDAKYAVTNDIMGKRTIYKTKWLEFLRRKNFEFLEAEDMWFLKAHYVDALARLLTVKKLDTRNIDGKTLDTIRALAIKEAQEATFRDANALAEALNAAMRRYSSSDKKLERFGGILMEGAMPFTKTPLNIAKQGVNYSPAGLLKGIYKSLAKLKNGEAYSTAEVIDDLAKGLTGTGLMLLGYFLRSMGLLSGAGDENKKKRAFDKMVGEQDYAFYIGDKSYTIDWMAPTCLPLFIGVELFELTDETLSVSDVYDAALTLADPLLELTVLSGLNSAIKSAQYSETNTISAIISELATGYTLQALPTIGGKLSRIIDKNKKEYYYTDKTKDIPKSIQRLIGRAASKIPFASLLFETSVDEWGREENYGNIFERVVENTLSPGYYSARNYTDVDEELKELYESTGDAAVLPTTQQKYYTKNKIRYNMSAEMYTKAKKLRGEKSFEFISKLIKSSAYKNMNDEQKVKAIKKCYERAGEETKKEMFEKVKAGSR